MIPKEIIIENVLYDGETLDYRCPAYSIDLIVLDKNKKQLYVNSPITIDEELATNQIYQIILKDNTLEEGEITHNNKIYKWRINTFQ